MAGTEIDPTEYLRLARAAAYKVFRGHEHLRDDLIQEGQIAILRAAKYYNGRGSFASYAWRGVILAMSQCINQMGHVVRLPRPSRGATDELRKLREIAEGEHRDVHRIPLHEASLSALDHMIHQESVAAVRECVDRLPDRLREIVIQRWWHGQSFPAIGRAMGLTGQRVAQLHSRALNILRESLECVA